MFFIASKVLGLFTLPSNIVLWIIVVGAALLPTRYTRLGRRVVLTGVLLMIVIGLSPLGTILLRVLENRFPPWQAGPSAPTGFIILGGPVNPDLSVERNTIALNDEAERLTVTADLARRFPAARFIYSGGNNSLLGGPDEATYAAALMESFGIARERIQVEDQSRNTAENAILSKALAAPKPGDRWVIVTSASHMPRAIGVFRSAGFEVEAFPVDWNTRRAGGAWTIRTTFLSGLGRTDLAAHEYIGLLAYWVTGRTSELFPGPR